MTMRTLLAVLVSASLAACGSGGEDPGAGTASAPGLADHSFADADVTRIHSRMAGVMAPDNGWERARYLEFDWMVARGEGEEPLRRSHAWDRWEGDYRLTAPTDDGEMVAIFNVDRPQEGRVWITGQEVTDPATRETLLDRAHGMFVNDSYWLLMPYKWADPGVTARYLGEETDPDGTLWEVVELSFDGVGRTPQNLYRGYVNPETGLMERWLHYRDETVTEPLVTGWTEWRRFGPIMLSSQRPTPEGPSRIFFENLRVETQLPTGAFAPPS